MFVKKLDVWGVLGFAFLLVVGCGSDESATSSALDAKDDEPEKISVMDTIQVESRNSLPSCDGGREGRSFFVRNENLPYFCVGGSWKSVRDSSGFGIACEDGFLHAVNKNGATPDGGNPAGMAPAAIHGSLQKGPFLFGGKVTLQAVDSANFYRAVDNGGPLASACLFSNDGRYAFGNANQGNGFVKVSVSGYYRNEVTGRASDKPVTISALSQMGARDSVNVNVLTHLEAPRLEQLAMNHVDFLTAKAQAEREIFAAFGIDTAFLYSQNYFQDGRMDKPLAEDLSMFGNSEYSAALFAISVMLQGDRTEDDMVNLMNNVAEDLKGDGVWNDPNWKIKIADWIVGLDSNWGYNEIRNNVSSWNAGPVPNFEKYLRAFYPKAYGFEPCGELNAGKVTFVNNGQSVYFANDFNHVDHSAVRFTCDVNSREWRVATAIEKDTAGFGAGTYDREVREGNVNYGTYYIYEMAMGTWRVATPQEADGFTDIGEVFANLKSDEKAVFVIRHGERTDDTSEKGHLTSNGVVQAQNVGAKLKSAEDFYFGYSGFTRTRETCENIAKGRGQSNYKLDVLPYMDGEWYVKDAAKADSYVNSDGGWVVYSKYAFAGAYSDAFYDLETRSNALVVDEIVANLPKMKRVNVMCTHDYLVVPLLAFATDGHANVRYYEKWKWVNYLAGVAIIVSPDGSIRYVPVKGLETGTM